MSHRDALSAGIIVAGWDKENGGTVYNTPLGGGLFQGPWAIGGELLTSGSLSGLLEGLYGGGDDRCILAVAGAWLGGEVACFHQKADHNVGPTRIRLDIHLRILRRDV